MRHEENDRRKAPLGGTSREWDLLYAILDRRQRQQHEGTTRSGNQDITGKKIHHEGREEEGSDTFSREGSRAWDGPHSGAARRLAGEERTQDSADIAGDADEELFGGDKIHIPTFAEVVDALKANPWEAPTAFRPSVSLCGQLHSPFDSVIPFERLQVCGGAGVAAVGIDCFGRDPGVFTSRSWLLFILLLSEAVNTVKPTGIFKRVLSCRGNISDMMIHLRYDD